MKLPLLVEVAGVSAVSRGMLFGHSVHGDHSRVSGAINPRSRQSLAGGALGLAIIEASGGAIDRRKHGNVIVIAWVGKCSELQKHGRTTRNVLSCSLPRVVATGHHNLPEPQSPRII